MRSEYQKSYTHSYATNTIILDYRVRLDFRTVRIIPHRAETKWNESHSHTGIILSYHNYKSSSRLKVIISPAAVWRCTRRLWRTLGACTEGDWWMGWLDVCQQPSRLEQQHAHTSSRGIYLHVAQKMINRSLTLYTTYITIVDYRDTRMKANHILRSIYMPIHREHACVCCGCTGGHVLSPSSVSFSVIGALR